MIYFSCILLIKVSNFFVSYRIFFFFFFFVVVVVVNMIDKSTWGVRGSWSSNYNCSALTSSILIRTTEYVTEQLLVVDSVVVVLPQIAEWSFALHTGPVTKTLRRLMFSSIKIETWFFLRECQPSFFNIIYCFSAIDFMSSFVKINTVKVFVSELSGICFVFQSYLGVPNHFWIFGSSFYKLRKSPFLPLFINYNWIVRIPSNLSKVSLTYLFILFSMLMV